MQQFKNLSSWREEKIVVTGNTVHTMTFIDSKPNMFYIQNPNNVKLRVSMGKYPTHENYEFTVDENSSATLGRPTPTGYLYIFVDGSVNADITIYSIADKFDLNILKNLSLQVDGATFETDGIVRGFGNGVSLPSGSNNLGYVQLFGDANTVKAILDEENSNNISTITSENTLMKNYLISILNMFNGNNTSNIFYKMLDELKEIAGGIADPSDSGQTYLNNVIEFSFTAENDCKIHFVWLMNDGGTVATVYRDETDLLTIMKDEHFTDIEFELKAGETLHIDSTQPMYRIKYYIY